MEVPWLVSCYFCQPVLESLSLIIDSQGNVFLDSVSKANMIKYSVAGAATISVHVLLKANANYITKAFAKLASKAGLKWLVSSAPAAAIVQGAGVGTVAGVGTTVAGVAGMVCGAIPWALAVSVAWSIIDYQKGAKSARQELRQKILVSLENLRRELVDSNNSHSVMSVIESGTVQVIKKSDEIPVLGDTKRLINRFYPEMRMTEDVVFEEI
jgi:hypothetical protein